MRLWMDDDLRMYTDEQLLQFIAYKGSLQSAAADGNITLVTEGTELSNVDKESAPNLGKDRRTLADYLHEG